MAAAVYSLNRLSAEFYKDYESARYPEIENKEDRPYMVLVIKIERNTFALPLRTNIRHNYGYKFKTSDRKTESCTGIDYTKAVIINDQKYIGEVASINGKEYVEIDRNAHRIIAGFERYLNGYIRYRKSGGTTYDQKRYRYSTLKYFHDELGLE